MGDQREGEVRGPSSAEGGWFILAEDSRKVLDGLLEGCMVLGFDWTFLYVNEAAARTLQQTRDGLLGRSILEMYPGAEANPIFACYRRCMNERVPQRMEGAFTFVNGVTNWWDVSVSPVAEGIFVHGVEINARKLAEEVLRASTERHRTILRTAMDGFWLADLQGRLVEVNEAYCRMSGYSERELLSMRISDLEAVESPEETAARARKIMARGSDRFESRHRRKDGTFFDVEVSVQHSPIEGGVMVAFLRDIGERKRAETVRRSLQEDLTATLEALPDLMFDIDREGRFFDFRAPNPGSLFAKPDEFLGRLVRDVLPPHAAEVVHEAISEAARKGIHVGSEFPLGMPDGERWFELSVAAKGSPAGGRERFVVLSRDITERKTAEEALRESEDRYRKLSEELEQRVEERTAELTKSRWLLDEISRLSQAGGWEYDLRTGALRWTDVIYEIYEVDPGLPLTVEGVFGYFAPESRVRMSEAFQRAVDTGEPYDVELELITAKGRRKWVRAIGYADLEGAKVVTVHGLFQDIQVQKEQMTALEGANRELEAFSYSVSHDLRAPLRAIEGFSGLLVRESSDHLTDEDRRLLEVVRTNARKMSDLIDDLLKLSRSSRHEIRHDMLSMRSIVLSAVEEVAGERETRAEIDLKLAELPLAEGDPTLIRQVWINLMSNALKFSARREQPLIEVGGAVDGPFAVYHVRDNGVGFDPKYVDKLFGVFQRLHGVKEFEGTGIGLALVKRIVERHGGRVWAEGTVGQGATFYFSLPVREEPETTVPAARGLPRPP